MQQVSHPVRLGLQRHHRARKMVGHRVTRRQARAVRPREQGPDIHHSAALAHRPRVDRLAPQVVIIPPNWRCTAFPGAELTSLKSCALSPGRHGAAISGESDRPSAKVENHAASPAKLRRPRRTEKMPPKISRRNQMRRRPTGASGGSRPRSTFHPASVRSSGYAGRVMAAPAPSQRALCLIRRKYAPSRCSAACRLDVESAELMAYSEKVGGCPDGRLELSDDYSPRSLNKKSSV